MIDHIVNHIVEEANKRPGQNTTANIYKVHIEVKEGILKVMEALRECERRAEEVRINATENKCEFYPKPGYGCVCAAGSDVAGPFVCTREYSEECSWANEKSHGSLSNPLADPLANDLNAPPFPEC